MKVLNRFMSALGYVPRAEVAASIATLKIEIDGFSALIDASAEACKQYADATHGLDRALSQLQSSPVEFATAELVADETPALILAELRKHTTLLEVLAKQGDQGLCNKSTVTTTSLDAMLRRHAPPPDAAGPTTGASASGLPG